MTSTINPALEGNPVTGYLKFAIPSVIALLALSAAPIIDGLFIANYLGVKSLASVNLLIPVFTISFGMAYMIAIGGSVSAGKYIGENNKDGASNIFSKSVVFGIIYSLIVVLSGWYWSEGLFALLGAEPELFPLMHDYFNTILWFFPIEIVSIISYYYIRISGFPTLTSVAIVTGVIVNLGLNYLFIARLSYGLEGAALATGISSIVMMSLMLLYKFSKNSWLKFTAFQSNWKEVFRAAYNGLSELIDEMSAGIVTFILNLIVIGSLGNEGVAAFSVVSYSLFVGYLFFFGLAEALQAVTSQCFGAKDKERLKTFLKITTITISLSAVLFSGLLLGYGDIFIGFFIDQTDTALIETAKGFIIILWPIFIFNGLNVIISAYLTSIHQPTASAIVATVRALIFPLALLYIITKFYPDISFLLAVTGGEILTLIIAVYFFLKHKPQKLFTSP